MTQCLTVHVYRNLNLNQKNINYMYIAYQFVSTSLTPLKRISLTILFDKIKTLRFAEMQEFEVMIFLEDITVYFMLVCVI